MSCEAKRLDVINKLFFCLILGSLLWWMASGIAYERGIVDGKRELVSRYMNTGWLEVPSGIVICEGIATKMARDNAGSLKFVVANELGLSSLNFAECEESKPEQSTPKTQSPK